MTRGGTHRSQTQAAGMVWRQRHPSDSDPEHGACACTETVPCALHYSRLPPDERLEVRSRVQVTARGIRPPPPSGQARSRGWRPPPETRQFVCRTCHTDHIGEAPPDGWFRIQQRDLAAEQDDGRQFHTRSLFCTPACLLIGAARIVEATVASPDHAARLHRLTEAAAEVQP
jgi:hypothetical protein